MWQNIFLTTKISLTQAIYFYIIFVCNFYSLVNNIKLKADNEIKSSKNRNYHAEPDNPAK